MTRWSHAYWSGWDIARSVTMWTAAPATSPGGWTLDAYGALHPFGSAPSVPASAYWSGWDIARGSAGAGSGSGGRTITDRVLGVPYDRQGYNLSCEEAALQMAMAYRGISSTQTDILTNIGIDYRPAYRDGGGFHWGNPYASFVGSPSGSEANNSGYGTYFGTIAATTLRYGGHVRFAGEGYPAQAVYGDILNGHPVVAWVSIDYGWHQNWAYTAFDGRPVQFGAPCEHAVTVSGVNRDSVLVNDPIRGRLDLLTLPGAQPLDSGSTLTATGRRVAHRRRAGFARRVDRGVTRGGGGGPYRRTPTRHPAA
ncbi:MAG: C39 family peptidase [Candidatus Dormibacteria bacterium]